MNKIILKVKIGALGALSALVAQTAIANSVTVKEITDTTEVIVSVKLNSTTTPYSNLNYTGGAYAGFENLSIYDSAKTTTTIVKGFCIDLYHYSSGAALTYNVAELQYSPAATPPGNMGLAKANFIKEMWAQYYNGALSDKTKAAGLQLAIWAVLQGTISGGVVNPTVVPNWNWLVSTDKYGADGIITWANSNSGPLANVVGLNQAVTGAQSYAIPVPDGGMTIALLGGALTMIGVVGRRARM